MSTSGPAMSRWRNPVFVLVLLTGAIPWLAFVGWLTWLGFTPVWDWVGRQNEMFHELLALLVLVPWGLGLAVGIVAAVLLAERAAGIRRQDVPATGQTHGTHAKWRRP